MLFSIVIKIDGFRPLRGCLPRYSLRKRLRGSYSESDYRYLAKESGDPEHSPWKNAVQWEGAGILTRVEFEALVDDIGAYASQTHSMGTLGGPLHGWGIVPDVDFTFEEQDAILSMRVTPILEHAKNECNDEERARRAWNKLEQAMWRQYKHGSSSHFSQSKVDPVTNVHYERTVPMAAREMWQRRFPTHGDAYAKAVQKARREAASNSEVAEFVR